MNFASASSWKAVHEVLIILLLTCDNLVASNGVEAEEGGSARPDTVPSECVKFPEDSCPSLDSACLCVSLAAPSILCCHLIHVEQLHDGIQCASSRERQKFVALHIRNSTIESSTLARASEYISSLSSLAITDGMPPIIEGHLSEIVPQLSCLNLSSNGMGDLPEEALRDLNALRALDLSANNITRLPRLPHRIGGQPLWIDISGNQHIGCSGILDAMSQNASSSHPLDMSSPSPLDVASSSSLPTTAIHFHNKRNTSCLTPKGYDWFNWTQRTPLVEVENWIKLQKECPSGEGYSCQCAIVRVELVPGRPPSFSASVDCSGRALLYLPVKLPHHTITLNVSNNNISSLESLGRNKYYSEIREFYADNNLISSIEVLEGSDFLSNFQSLTLSGNKLKELPMYILQSIFDRSMIYRYMKLGKNKYNCDCNTYHELRAWVMKHKKNIYDYEEMVCEAQEPPVKIIDLQKEKVCLHKTDWMDYLPVVVVAEVLLLVCLVTKVSYDYWIFKTTGYLPWPASRTPKLPCCDWAFDA